MVTTDTPLFLMMESSLYARQHRLSPNSVQAQIGYLWQEIQAGNEGVNAAQLNNLATPAQVAQLFSSKFERPAAWAANNATRQKYANNFYSQYGK